MDKFLKFLPLVKVDEAQRIVYGLVTAEYVDKDGEVCHYDTTKCEYQKVNEEMGKASAGQNIMPLREMHGLNAVGAGKTIEFDDSRKQIKMAFKVVDDACWKKVQEKVLLGFSQGGRYVKKWNESGRQFYTAQPGEVSLVDNPCLPGAFIEYAKADGSVELYRAPDAKLSDEELDRIVKAMDSDLDTRVKKITAPLTELVAKLTAATGATTMKPEDIKKYAAQLGITEEEFTKTIGDDKDPPAGGALTKADLEPAIKAVVAPLIEAAVTKALEDAKKYSDEEVSKVRIVPRTPASAEDVQKSAGGHAIPV